MEEKGEVRMCEEYHDGAGSDEATTTPGEKEEGLRKVLERAYGCIEKTRKGESMGEW